MSAVDDTLAGIEAEHGFVTAALLVDVARPKSHPLHSRFVWDGKEAIEALNLRIAQGLIRRVRVTYPAADGTSRPAPGWLAVTRPVGERARYEPVDRVLADPIMAEVVLRQAEREFRAMWNRYRHLSEFRDLLVAALSDVA